MNLTTLPPDPSSPVQPFEAHDHSAQRFSLSLVDVEQSDAITILGHLLPSIERIRLLKQVCHVRSQDTIYALPAAFAEESYVAM